MFGYIPAAEQAVKERARNAALMEASNRNAANIDYIAMMCDVDIDTDADETNGEEGAINE